MTETRGHPYLLHAYGQATWDAAEGATLTYDDARLGKTLTITGSFRDSLIKKSLIYSPDQGRLSMPSREWRTPSPDSPGRSPVRSAGRTYEVQNLPRDTIRGSRPRVHIQALFQDAKQSGSARRRLTSTLLP